MPGRGDKNIAGYNHTYRHAHTVAGWVPPTAALAIPGRGDEDITGYDGRQFGPYPRLFHGRVQTRLIIRRQKSRSASKANVCSITAIGLDHTKKNNASLARRWAGLSHINPCPLANSSAASVLRAAR